MLRIELFREIVNKDKYFDYLLSSQERNDPPTEKEILEVLGKIKDNVHRFSGDMHWKLVLLSDKWSKGFTSLYKKPCPIQIYETHMVVKIRPKK